MFLIFNIFFSSRFRPPNFINFATVVYSNSTFLTFYFNIHHTRLPHSLCLYYRGGTFISNGILKIVFLRERWQTSICIITSNIFNDKRTRVNLKVISNNRVSFFPKENDLEESIWNERTAAIVKTQGIGRWGDVYWSKR